MKILHTSDWHLGHLLYNYDRTEEQAAMLQQMAEIVRQQQPDAFVLSGDVYHTPQPSATVQTMLTEALVEIHRACPAMVIVMTAGNHDSGTKHEIFRTPWKALNVYAIGAVTGEDGELWEQHVVEVPGKGLIVAVPYCHERNLPENFFQRLLDEVEQRNTAGLPVVLMAHTTVRGCDATGHDHATDLLVGGIDAIDLDQLGQGYDYLALGHIHHQQWVHSGKHNVRYCGTPLPISFDENFAHSVSLVEIARHCDTPKVETIEIDNPHPVVTLPAEGFVPWEQAKELLAQFPDDIPAYIRLNVEIEDFLPVEANAEAVQIAQGKACRFCHINTRRKIAPQSETKVMTVQEFQSEEPIEIVRNYAEYLGVAFDEEMEAMFREVEKEVDK
jgi:exonuclease SbcD